MGKGYLDLKHFDGPNYTEVDIDIGSSRIARGVVGVVIPSAKKLVVDEAFLIEGQRDDELPERLLGMCRCVHYDLSGNTIPIADNMLVGGGGGGDVVPIPLGVDATLMRPASAPLSGGYGAATDVSLPQRAGEKVMGSQSTSPTKSDHVNTAVVLTDVVNDLGAAFDITAGVAAMTASRLGDQFGDDNEGAAAAEDADEGAIAAGGRDSESDDEFYDALGSPPTSPHH